MKKIRAVLMDMDGTLLGKSQVAVSAANMEAVQKAIAAGIEVIPCTGRTYATLPPQLQTQPGLRYFVLAHGARAFDLEKGVSLYEDLIPHEEAAVLMEGLEGKGLFNEIAADGTLYMEKAVVNPVDYALVPEHHVWYMRDRIYTEMEKPSEFIRREKLSVEKMNLYNIPEALQQEVYDFVTATGFVGHTFEGAGPHLEFLHKGLDKLCAVKTVLDKVGVSFEETLAIGDSGSDLAIIRACGVGVAMGNAPDSIKAEADFVTDLNVNDGLAAAFHTYLSL